MRRSTRRRLKRRLAFLGGALLELGARLALLALHLALAVCFVWLAVYLVAGDLGGALLALNAVAAYLFIPAPVALLVGVLQRRRGMVIAAGAALLAWLLLWGGYYIPVSLRQPASAAQAAQPGEYPASGLVVMTYNVLGLNTDPAPVLANVHRADPDLLLLQELHPEMAAGLLAELGAEYPYQWLAPAADVTGMGILSRVPFEPQEVVFAGRWIGAPQVIRLTWGLEPVTVANLHFITPGGMLNIPAMIQRHPQRQESLAALVDFVDRTEGALILAGDFNAAPLNDVYRQIAAAGLQNAWSQAGYGLGNTWPSRRAGFYLPLTRIDHVFVSSEWQVSAAQVAADDGQSDHRGVVVRLNFR